MRYIKNQKGISWIGTISDDSEIPTGFIEITKEEYLELQKEFDKIF